MGSSGDQTKTVTSITEYSCPNIVNKDNWLGRDYYPDTFSVQQREKDIVVTRTDSASGWDMDLKFQCCGKVSNVHTFYLVKFPRKLELYQHIHSIFIL